MEKRSIDVNHQLLGNKTSGFHIGTLKTKSSYRQIPMSETVFKALQRILLRSRPENFVVDGYSNFVFFNENGIPRNAKSYRGAIERIAKRYVESDGIPLPPISSHIFRHTFCTNMANRGMNPKALQYIMGHKSITVTLDYYAHVNYSSAKEEMERVLAS